MKLEFIWIFLAKYLKPWAKQITTVISVILAGVALLQEQVFDWLCGLASQVAFLSFGCTIEEGKAWAIVLAIVKVLDWVNDKLHKHIPAEVKIGPVDLPEWAWITSAFVLAFLLIAFFTQFPAFAVLFLGISVFVGLVALIRKIVE